MCSAHGGLGGGEGGAGGGGDGGDGGGGGSQSAGHSHCASLTQGTFFGRGRHWAKIFPGFLKQPNPSSAQQNAGDEYQSVHRSYLRAQLPGGDGGGGGSGGGSGGVGGDGASGGGGGGHGGGNGGRGGRHQAQDVQSC